MKKHFSILLSIVLFFGIFAAIHMGAMTNVSAVGSKNFVVYLYPGHSPATSAKFEATLN